MKRIKIFAVGTLAAAAAGAILIATSGSAFADPPGFEPDPNASLGWITFFDSSGSVVTSGTDLSHLFDYAVASTPSDRSGVNKASLTFAFPDHTKVPTLWNQQPAAGPTNDPVTGAPYPVSGYSTPAVASGATGANLSTLLSTTTLDTTPGYANIVEIRLKDSGPGNPTRTSPYWRTDISFDQTAGTWSVVYPTSTPPPANPPVPTGTTLDESPASGTPFGGDTVTLTAHVTSQVTGHGVDPSTLAGSVKFFDGGTQVGAAVPVSSGDAQTTTTALAAGSHSLSAQFTPTDATAWGSSTSETDTYVVNGTTATTTSAAISGDYTHPGQDSTLTATVTPAAANGSVAFFDNGSTTAIPGTVTNSGNVYTLHLASGFAIGNHSIVANFTPSSRSYGASDSSANPITFVTSSLPAYCQGTGGTNTCSTVGNVKAVIPVGALTISTPYTPSNPIDLGTLGLNTNDTLWVGSASVSNIVVTDTRSGENPWTASALAGNLTDTTDPSKVINGENLGFTGVSGVTSSGMTGTFTPQDIQPGNGLAPGDTGNAGLGGTTPHAFGSVNHGPGTVTIGGTLKIQAPTSTKDGTYKGTITFTVG